MPEFQASKEVNIVSGDHVVCANVTFATMSHMERLKRVSNLGDEDTAAGEAAIRFAELVEERLRTFSCKVYDLEEQDAEIIRRHDASEAEKLKKDKEYKVKSATIGFAKYQNKEVLYEVGSLEEASHYAFFMDIYNAILDDIISGASVGKKLQAG